MRYEVRIRREVVDDLEEGRDWYEGQAAGLGDRFIGEYVACLDRVSASPLIYAAGHRGERTARLNRFPYLMKFRVVGTVVDVFAVVYGGRNPRYWKKRLK